MSNPTTTTTVKGQQYSDLPSFRMIVLSVIESLVYNSIKTSLSLKGITHLINTHPLVLLVKENMKHNTSVNMNKEVDVSDVAKAITKIFKSSVVKINRENNDVFHLQMTSIEFQEHIREFEEFYRDVMLHEIQDLEGKHKELEVKVDLIEKGQLDEVLVREYQKKVKPQTQAQPQTQGPLQQQVQVNIEVKPSFTTPTTSPPKQTQTLPPRQQIHQHQHHPGLPATPTTLALHAASQSQSQYSIKPSSSTFTSTAKATTSTADLKPIPLATHVNANANANANTQSSGGNPFLLTPIQPKPIGNIAQTLAGARGGQGQSQAQSQAPGIQQQSPSLTPLSPVNLATLPLSRSSSASSKSPSLPLNSPQGSIPQSQSPSLQSLPGTAGSINSSTTALNQLNEQQQHQQSQTHKGSVPGTTRVEFDSEPRLKPTLSLPQRKASFSAANSNVDTAVLPSAGGSRSGSIGSEDHVQLQQAPASLSASTTKDHQQEEQVKLSTPIVPVSSTTTTSTTLQSPQLERKSFPSPKNLTKTPLIKPQQSMSSTAIQHTPLSPVVAPSTDGSPLQATPSKPPVKSLQPQPEQIQTPQKVGNQMQQAQTSGGTAINPFYPLANNLKIKSLSSPNKSDNTDAVAPQDSNNGDIDNSEEDVSATPASTNSVKSVEPVVGAKSQPLPTSQTSTTTSQVQNSTNAPVTNKLPPSASIPSSSSTGTSSIVSGADSMVSIGTNKRSIDSLNLASDNDEESNSGGDLKRFKAGEVENVEAVIDNIENAKDQDSKTDKFEAKQEQEETAKSGQSYLDSKDENPTKTEDIETPKTFSNNKNNKKVSDNPDAETEVEEDAMDDVSSKPGTTSSQPVATKQDVEMKDTTTTNKEKEVQDVDISDVDPNEINKDDDDDDGGSMDTDETDDEEQSDYGQQSQSTTTVNKELLNLALPLLDRLSSSQNNQCSPSLSTPNYTTLIKSPQSFEYIKTSLQKGKIQTKEELERAVLLMFANDVMFYQEGSKENEDAKAKVAQWDKISSNRL